MVQFDGVERGPFSVHEIEEMVEQKILTPHHTCSLDVQPRTWLPIRMCIPLREQTEEAILETKPSTSWIQTLVVGFVCVISPIILWRPSSCRRESAEVQNGEMTLKTSSSSPQLKLVLLIGAIVSCTLVCMADFVRLRLKNSPKVARVIPSVNVKSLDEKFK